MPGAFAHLVAANLALVTPKTEHLLPNYSRRVLPQYQRYVELGAVSPDFPYLALTNSEQVKWADRMHRQYVDVFLKLAIYHVKSLEGMEQDIAYSWLSGYLSHVIADITIHPVIERTVGHYLQNKQAHRLCEMHQDTYIWQRMSLGEIGTKSWLTDHLLFCTSLNDKASLDPIIRKVWQESLELAFPIEANPPDINGWLQSFIKVIGLVEDNYRLFPLSRHVASFLKLTYPKVSELQSGYLNQLPTPAGAMSYDAIFDHCVTQIISYQQRLYHSVFDDQPLSWVKNWSLDTGLCPEGVLSTWQHLEAADL